LWKNRFWLRTNSAEWTWRGQLERPLGPSLFDFWSGQKNPRMTPASSQNEFPSALLWLIRARDTAAEIPPAQKSRRKIMFSIFDYLRRRTCDSMLAGAYDALEILESEKAVTVTEPTEIADGNKTAKQNSLPQPAPAPLKAPEPLKIVAPHKPPPASIPQKTPLRPQQQPQKPPSPQPPQGQAGKSPPAPSEKKPAAPAPVAPSGPPAQKPAPPPPDLFNGEANQEKPLPPRKRGRPRKYPPGGNTQ
jgi:hypothetical protein